MNEINLDTITKKEFEDWVDEEISSNLYDHFPEAWLLVDAVMYHSDYRDYSIKDKYDDIMKISGEVL